MKYIKVTIRSTYEDETISSETYIRADHISGVVDATHVAIPGRVPYEFGCEVFMNGNGSHAFHVVQTAEQVMEMIGND